MKLGPKPAKGQPRNKPIASSVPSDFVSFDIRDDEALVEMWNEAVAHSKVMYQGKQFPMLDMLKWARSKMTIPIKPTLPTIKAAEVKIGNLLQEITVELVQAEVASREYAERRRDRFGAARIKKGSKTDKHVEGELIHGDPEYRILRGIVFSAEANREFWASMRKLCLETLDRIKAIGMLEAAEVKRFGPGQY